MTTRILARCGQSSIWKLEEKKSGGALDANGRKDGSFVQTFLRRAGDSAPYLWFCEAPPMIIRPIDGGFERRTFLYGWSGA